MNKIKNLLNNRFFWIVAGVFLLTALALLTIYLIYTKDQPKFIPEKAREDIRGSIKEEIAKPLAKSAPAVGSPLVKAAYVVPDETAGWPTYDNEDIGYNIKYPDTWKIFLGEGGTVSFGPESDDYTGVTIYKVTEKTVQDWLNNYQLGADTRLEKINSKLIKNFNVAIYRQVGGLVEAHYVVEKEGKILDILPTGNGDQYVEKIISTINY